MKTLAYPAQSDGALHFGYAELLCAHTLGVFGLYRRGIDDEIAPIDVFRLLTYRDGDAELLEALRERGDGLIAAADLIPARGQYLRQTVHRTAAYAYQMYLLNVFGTNIHSFLQSGRCPSTFIIFYLKEKGKYILEAGGASGRTPRKRAPLVRSKGFPRAAK